MLCNIIPVQELYVKVKKKFLILLALGDFACGLLPYL